MAKPNPPPDRLGGRRRRVPAVLLRRRRAHALGRLLGECPHGVHARSLRRPGAVRAARRLRKAWRAPALAAPLRLGLRQEAPEKGVARDPSGRGGNLAAPLPRTWRRQDRARELEDSVEGEAGRTA